MNNLDPIIEAVNNTDNNFLNSVSLKLQNIYHSIVIFFSPDQALDSGPNFNSVLANVKVVLFILSLFFVFVIVYCFVRIFEIRKKEHHHLEHEIEEYAHHKKDKEEHLTNPGGAMNEKWQSVLTRTFSDNEADWRLAIVEADIMLEELMDQLGFKGEGLGEKLKSADQEKFKQLTHAWEAHIVRNKIAHEGSEFLLTQREAKRVVTLYEDIFRAYGFI